MYIEFKTIAQYWNFAQIYHERLFETWFLMQFNIQGYKITPTNQAQSRGFSHDFTLKGITSCIPLILNIPKLPFPNLTMLRHPTSLPLPLHTPPSTTTMGSQNKKKKGLVFLFTKSR